MRINAFLPLGSQIKQALEEEEKDFAVKHTDRIQKLNERLLSRISDTELPADGEPPGEHGAKNAAVKPTLAPVIGICAMTAAAAATAFGLALARNADAPPRPDPLPLVEDAQIHTEGEIVFTGGDPMLEHADPLHAMVWAVNESGALQAKMWWITDTEYDEVLYCGEGGDADGVFAEMRGAEMTGHYVIHFIMEDNAGGICTLSRRFLLRAAP